MTFGRRSISPQMTWERDRAAASRIEKLLRNGYALIKLDDVHSDFDRLRAQQVAEGQAKQHRERARREEQHQNEHYRR